MCPKCRAEVASNNNKCTVCGKSFDKDSTLDDFVNPNFNVDRYNKLASGINENTNDNDDINLEMVDDKI